ncbi:hypothetical protein TrRE_jg13397 [Triparma retinervis]|uniref:UDP-N-acetylglucosamine--dolichyl-phosphate N-acetylglucosaminephosphotransferase n=1 Tax=Triparma retinervis TaxID=2557542 RepID=A0A9W6ZFR0_9STRA|nr:hypothetical protein TrRE_jg13397 [Triparma retinervis]
MRLLIAVYVLSIISISPLPLLPPPTTSPLYNYFILYISPALAYIIATWGIDNLEEKLVKRGLFGLDIGKRGTKREKYKVPEALGVVTGISHVVVLSLTTYLCRTSTPPTLPVLLSSLTSILFMLFLGFTDDVLEWGWTAKLVLPTVSSIPLVAVYDGSTSVVAPRFLHSLFWTPPHQSLTSLSTFLANLGMTVYPGSRVGLIDVSWVYGVYMSLLSIFTSNCINIYAGINGLEVGQSVVISCCILLHNAHEISAGVSSTQQHWFSVMVLLPFLTGSLALLRKNWYPASCFVGDTYCYSAGVVFAVVGIHGHFSKTLLLFFIPQVLNFLLSLPQLLKVVPCPRHRLPRYNKSTGLMEPSEYALPGGGKGTNLTLINAWLKVGGPKGEERLTFELLVLQVAMSAVGMCIRYKGIGRGLIFEDEEL